MAGLKAGILKEIPPILNFLTYDMRSRRIADAFAVCHKEDMRLVDVEEINT